MLQMPDNVKHQVKMKDLMDAEVHPYVSGRMDDRAVAGPSLWKEHGAVIMAVRRCVSNVGEQCFVTRP